MQAFHVGYWNYIGWVDRFAAPAHSPRQRQIAAANHLCSIYTHQVVLNGKDIPNWRVSRPQQATKQPARLAITEQKQGVDQFEARIAASGSSLGSPAPDALPWSAYWTVMEHGHNSRVKSKEIAGEFLQHDFVVRQYTQAGDYTTSDARPQSLTFRTIAATPGQQRQINLVVFDKRPVKRSRRSACNVPLAAERDRPQSGRHQLSRGDRQGQPDVRAGAHSA